MLAEHLADKRIFFISPTAAIRFSSRSTFLRFRADSLMA